MEKPETSKESSGLSNLNALNFEQLNQLSVLLMRFLVSPQGIDLAKETAEYSKTFGMNYRAVKKLAKLTIEFLQSSIESGLSPKVFKDKCFNKGLNSSSTEVLINSYRQHFEELNSSLTYEMFDINQLVDMEWSFGVTIATDEISKLGSAYVRMKLVLEKGSQESQVEYLELSTPQFYKFLATMEALKTQLEYLSTAS